MLEEWIKRFPGLRGVYVQEQVSGAIEIILGAVYDPVLGHAVLAGQGGTKVELYKDVAFGHVPVSRQDALGMLKSLRCYPLLKGYRGEPGADIPQLAELVLRVDRLLRVCPNIRELDINPLIYDPNRGGFYAVDARIRI